MSLVLSTLAVLTEPQENNIECFRIHGVQFDVVSFDSTKELICYPFF